MRAPSRLALSGLSCVVLLLVFSVGALRSADPPAAQNPPQAQLPAPTAPQGGTLRVTTRLVEVSVVVLDRSDRPVQGLNRDDFAIFDNGVPQEVAVFGAQPGAAPAARAALPPGTFSNRSGNAGDTPPTATVILLDGLNTFFMDQKNVKKQVAGFLSNLRPNDCVALYALGRSSVWVVHEFTTDSREILAALDRTQGKKGPKVDGSRGLEEWLRDANVLAIRNPEYMRDMRPENTLRALEAISNHLAKIPGRKNLVWVSGSFPMTVGDRGLSAVTSRYSMGQNSFENEIARSALAINNANVAIYPVDTRGLEGWMPPPPPGWQGPAGRPVYPNPRGNSGLSQLTMNQIASRTGGRAFYNTNDIGGAIRRAVDEAEAAYVLAYYPNHGNWDGRFHQITVRVRRGGIQVRHRRGYFATDNAIANEQQRREVLREAAWSSLEATAIGMTAHITRSKTSASSALNIELSVDPRDITLLEDSGHWRGGLDFLFLGRAPGTSEQKNTSDSIEIDLPNDRHDDFMRRGINVSKEIDVPPGTTEIRILVRDLNSGGVGSVIVPLSKLN